MANKTTTMLQIRRILQLLEKGNSNRKTAALVGISRNTADIYIQRFKASKLSYTELLDYNDEQLSAVVYNQESSSRKDSRYERLAPQLSTLVKELTRRGVTRLLLWQEYRQQDVDGYSYQQFCEHINTYLQVNSAVMHLNHKPGNKIEIDFAGGKMHYVDKRSGELIACPVLVAVFPFSGYTYAEAMVDMGLEHLIPALGRCLEYFGGTAEYVVSDNLKQMVKKSSRYEPVFTELAKQWSLHYNTTLLATRVAKPRDKSTVEKAVDIAYKRIYAPLRNHHFGSLCELDHHVKLQLEKHNDALFQKKDYSRKELFLQEEKHLLGSLPKDRFEVRYSVKAKVQKNYHVTLGQDWHHYSVPYQYIGKSTTIVYDSENVEVYIGQKRIAFHKRNMQKHDHSTLEHHMPEKHLKYKQACGYTADYFLEKASKVGPCFKQAVDHILNSRHFTEQTYNACLGLLRLQQQYSNDRLDKASQMAISLNMVTYTFIRTILVNNRDKQLDIGPANIPKHDNIRGKQTYLFTKHK